MRSLKKRLTFGSKNDINYLANFNANSAKSENIFFDVIFL